MKVPGISSATFSWRFALSFWLVIAIFSLLVLFGANITDFVGFNLEYYTKQTFGDWSWQHICSQLFDLFLLGIISILGGLTLAYVLAMLWRSVFGNVSQMTTSLFRIVRDSTRIDDRKFRLQFTQSDSVKETYYNLQDQNFRTIKTFVADLLDNNIHARSRSCLNHICGETCGARFYPGQFKSPNLK